MRLPVLIGLLAMLTGWSANTQVYGATNSHVAPPSIAYLTPEQEAATFFCQDDYRMELVMGDPLISDPVVTVFDGNGRMYVAEMRSFMTNADGTNERAYGWYRLKSRAHCRATPIPPETHS